MPKKRTGVSLSTNPDDPLVSNQFVRLKGRTALSPREKVKGLRRMAAYCRLHQVSHQWYQTQGGEYFLVVCLPLGDKASYPYIRDEPANRRLRVQARRYGLSLESRRLGAFPSFGMVAPPGEESPADDTL